MGGIFVLLFLLYQISTEGKQLDRYVVALSEKNAQEAAFIKIRRLVDETEAERNQLATAFFSDESDSITFLGEIEEFARGISLDLKTLDLNKAASQDGKMEYISIKFSYTGSKDQTQNFTTYLETVPYHSEITALSLEQEYGGTWRGEATLHISITPS
jgi:hypothetical protein